MFILPSVEGEWWWRRSCSFWVCLGWDRKFLSSLQDCPCRPPLVSPSAPRGSWTYLHRISYMQIRKYTCGVISSFFSPSLQHHIPVSTNEWGLRKLLFLTSNTIFFKKGSCWLLKCCDCELSKSQVSLNSTPFSISFKRKNKNLKDPVRVKVRHLK